MQRAHGNTVTSKKLWKLEQNRCSDLLFYDQVIDSSRIHMQNALHKHCEGEIYKTLDNIHKTLPKNQCAQNATPVEETLQRGQNATFVEETQRKHSNAIPVKETTQKCSKDISCPRNRTPVLRMRALA